MPLAVAILFALIATRAISQSCLGDCNGDNSVTVDEIILGVNIALELVSTSRCPSFDRDLDGNVEIDELIRVVDLALNGCPATPSPTTTRSMTATVASSLTPSAPPTATVTSTPAPSTATPTSTRSLTPSVEPTDSLVFSDITAEAGLNDIDSLVGSAVWADLDGDGLPDLVTAPPLQVRRNLGGRFAAPIAAIEPASVEPIFEGVAAGYMTEGTRPDLVVMRDHELMVLRNEGSLNFTVVARVTVPGVQVLMGAGIADLNDDGHLDIITASVPADSFDPNTSPDLFNCHIDMNDGFLCDGEVRHEPKHVYLGDGKGNLTLVADALGVDGVGLTLTLGHAPVGSEGRQALLAINDFGQPDLYEHDGQGRLVDKTLASGLALFANGMGIDFGDLDDDGDLDIYMTDTPPHMLYQNDGHGRFTQIGEDSGVRDLTFASTGWGVVFADLDNDGDLDIAIACGNDQLRPHDSPFRSLILLNDGTAHFKSIDYTRAPALRRMSTWRTVVAGDIDGDGDQDVLFIPVNDPPLLLRNDLVQRGPSWSVVPVEQNGAVVQGSQVWFEGGGRRWLRGVWGPRHTLTTPEFEAFFALPPGIAQLERVQVVAPDGRTAETTHLPERGRITVSLPPR